MLNGIAIEIVRLKRESKNRIAKDMLRQLAVLIFILALAGQASAFVCDCIKNSDAHVCCEKGTPSSTSISTRGCCTQNCLTIPDDTLLQNRIENTTGIYPTVSLGLTSSQRRFGLRPPFFADTSAPQRFSLIENAALEKLYLRNHTFRI